MEKISFKECIFEIYNLKTEGVIIDTYGDTACLNLQEIIELRNWLNKIIYIQNNTIVEV